MMGWTMAGDRISVESWNDGGHIAGGGEGGRADGFILQQRQSSFCSSYLQIRRPPWLDDMFYDVNANADLDLDPKIQMGILIL